MTSGAVFSAFIKLGYEGSGTPKVKHIAAYSLDYSAKTIEDCGGWKVACMYFVRDLACVTKVESLQLLKVFTLSPSRLFSASIQLSAAKNEAA
jgi:hypothetical protein